MTQFLFLSLLLIQTSALASENDAVRISEDIIAEHTTFFDIRDNRIVGADSLLAALEQAHFVTLGELHNRVRLGELTESLLHILEPHGFSNFAIETGPYSARKLQQLIRSGKQEVSSFYSQYSSRLFDLIPIPFFKGDSDVQFLSAADSLGYELWGMDQEFYFSYTYLIDELARLAGESLTVEQQKLQRKLIRRLYWLDRRNQLAETINSNFQRSCRFKQDENLEAYLLSFENSDHPDILQILDAFNSTLEIYCLAEQGKASEPIRINYFKENFDRNFDAALAENNEPKVFLKMGTFHMGRQRSPINLYGIGNHVHQLAESKGQSSVHIYYLNRFFEGKDMKGRRGWEGSERFISVGDRQKWALIDLRPLREQLSSGTLSGSDFEVRTIWNYDFIIVAPEDDWVKRHW
ncbi:MAG: hypothetical protein LAT57_02580 [Balneolales bacterium]|nr:hypothetical protein [Balneolales bacterium]